MSVRILFTSILWTLGVTVAAWGQSVKGIVKDDNGKGLPGVMVEIRGLQKITFTNEQGGFELKVPEQLQEFSLLFHLLGKKDVQLDFQRDSVPATVLVVLLDNDLYLDELVVTEQRETNGNSSATVFEEQAINLLQAQSLAEVMTLLPGKRIEQPEMFRVQTLSLRTANPDRNNSFGVSFLIDDIPLSQNENMQLYRPHTKGFNPVNQRRPTNDPAGGIDLRTIPVGNITKVEVNAGITDARYGDATTGLVRIEREAGKAPYKLRMTMRGGSYSFSLTKGYKLSKRSQLNASLDYLHAAQDPRDMLTQYKRVTGNLLWTVRNRKNRLRNTVSASVSTNLDGEKEEPNSPGRNTAKEKNHSFRFSNRLHWSPKKVLDRLSFNTGFSFGIQQTRRTSFVNNGGNVVALGMETGMYEATYTPVAYTSVREVDGKPLSAHSRLEGDKSFWTGKIRHRINAGIEINFSDNLGEGRKVSSENLDVQLAVGNGVGERSYAFKDRVPASWRWALYLQDNMIIPLGQKELETKLGFRYDRMNGYVSMSPRLNLGMKIHKNWHWRGGVGYFTKAPSLVHMYNGNLYYDFLLADHRNNYYARALVYTLVRDGDVTDLKPSKSWKTEMGLDFKKKGYSLSLTGYYSKRYDGFEKKSLYEQVNIPKLQFEPVEPTRPPLYEQTGEEKVLIKYTRMTNAHFSHDYGAEVLVSTPKLQEINTSFTLSGAYWVTETSSTLPHIINSNDPLSEELKAFHKRAKNLSKELNLRFTVVHHIPEVGLVFTLIAEQFLIKSNKNYFDSPYPYAYLDRNLVYHELSEEERANEKYAHLWIQKVKVTDTHAPLVYHNFHIRASKQMSNGIQLSFYANNFLNYRPTYRDNENKEKRLNEAISFGGQLTITL
ncbi:TonB-dependent receptor [Rapidithrix thailandica]|uniref:TonB-dependent receptor n=1 Tax=Rapidithrix thailandica TaxID=413964 RepID=A0AAW9S1P3_9BACT